MQHPESPPFIVNFSYFSIMPSVAKQTSIRFLFLHIIWFSYLFTITHMIKWERVQAESLEKCLYRNCFQNSSEFYYLICSFPISCPDFSIYEKGLDVISKMHYYQTQKRRIILMKTWRKLNVSNSVVNSILQFSAITLLPEDVSDYTRWCWYTKIHSVSCVITTNLALIEGTMVDNKWPHSVPYQCLTNC